jgi:hypothetical protein
MQVRTYNPISMDLVSEDATGVSFGNTVRGGYTSAPVVIKPVATTEGSFTRLALFMTDIGGLSATTFRSFKSATAIPGIGSGSAYLSNHFTRVTVSDFTNYSTISGYGVALTAATPEYVWMDCRVGSADTVGSANVNYRFIFEYA